LNRRRFLRRAAWAAGFLGLRPAVLSGRSIEAPVARQARRLAGIFARPASAARVGRAYLRDHPDQASLARLVQQLAAGWPGGAQRIERLSAAQLRRRLDRAIRADFAAGRTVRVEGWVLAESEARLLGLTTLAS
jgi:hypothetical protein